MFTSIRTASGATRRLPDHLDSRRVVGLDSEGRIVVDDFAALTTNTTDPDRSPFLFGLTLCCNAYDKGMEDGVYCRACYGAKSDDSGSYLFAFGDERLNPVPFAERLPADRFPGFDPAVEFRVSNGGYGSGDLPIPEPGGVAVRSYPQSTGLVSDNLVALVAAHRRALGELAGAL